METSTLSPSHLTKDMSAEPMFKMDDFHNTPSLPSPAPSSTLSASKPVKKRKSWGQELPEPTTTLPPRKRAKTEAEKEQRRIERIKRNRAAAHNSRERKRLEAEQLSVANDGLNRTIEHLKRQLAMRDAQLAKCKELIPGGIPQIPSEDFGSLPFDMSDESRLVPTHVAIHVSMLT